MRTCRFAFLSVRLTCLRYRQPRFRGIRIAGICEMLTSSNDGCF